MNNIVFNTLSILLFYPFLSIIYHIYGTQNMVLNNFEKPYMYIILGSFIFTSIIGILLVKHYTVIGASIMSVLTIVIPVLSMIIYLQINLNSRKVK